MSQAPIIPPTQQLNYATPAAAGGDLRSIAMNQRAIIYCILGQFAVGIIRAVVPAELSLAFFIPAIAVSVLGAVFTFKLAINLYNTGMGVLLGIVTLVPFVGIVTLLVVNSRATATLRKYGIKVTLMGADPKQIPTAGQTPIR